MSLRATWLVLPLVSACADPTLEPVDLGYDGGGEIIEGEFVIQADLTQRELDTLGLTQVRYNPSLGWGLYVADDGVSTSAIERALAQSRGVGVEPNRPREGSAVNDPFREYQWNMTAIDVELAWALTSGDGVRVAVLDSGFGKDGEDTPKRWLAGHDFVDDDGDPNDLNGHGTHVAGTVAQATNNGRGAVGVAPDAEIMPLRVLGANNKGDAYTIAEAITYAVDHGAQVINLSLGHANSTQVERDAVRYAVQHDVILVAATGNEGASAVNYPAGYDGVIGVGATRFDNTVTRYSNRGPGVDLVAPGGDKFADQNGDGLDDAIVQEIVVDGYRSYGWYQGTSMASPHVAGAVALLLSAGADPDEVEGLLTSTARDVGDAGFDTTSGHGLIQPAAALQKLRNGAWTPPPPADVPVDDTAAPMIDGLAADQAATLLSIRWRTDEPATSHVVFDGDFRYGNDDHTLDHELRFTVEPGATYWFAVESTDAAGNTATSDRIASR